MFRSSKSPVVGRSATLKPSSDTGKASSVEKPTKASSKSEPKKVNQKSSNTSTKSSTNKQSGGKAMLPGKRTDGASDHPVSPAHTSKDQDFGTQAWKNHVMDSVTRCMTTDETKAFKDQAHSRSIGLQQILGQDPNDWWRIFIDPDHWNEAETFSKKTGKNPGYYYDEPQPNGQYSPGFHDAMVETYKTYLEHDGGQGELDQYLFTTTPIPGVIPLPWAKYEEIWRSIDPKKPGPDGKPQMVKGDSAGNVSTPSNEKLALDVNKPWEDETEDSENYFYLVGYEKDDSLLDKPDERERTDKAKQKGATLKTKFRRKHTGGPGLIMRAGESWENTKLFFGKFVEEFNSRIKDANTREKQLKAIAFMIRSVHVYHSFTDGNGRLNVYTLLPAMLLRYGFGLPLKGPEKGVPHNAMSMMFNGGFTLDEISKFLWVSQDFGKYDNSGLPPSLLGPHQHGGVLPSLKKGSEHSKQSSAGTSSHDQSHSHEGEHDHDHDSTHKHDLGQEKVKKSSMKNESSVKPPSNDKKASTAVKEKSPIHTDTKAQTSKNKKVQVAGDGKSTKTDVKPNLVKQPTPRRKTTVLTTQHRAHALVL